MRRIPVEPNTLAVGTVLSYDVDDGHGVVVSDATPGHCWVHCATLRDAVALRPGQSVWFVYETVDQDGFHYRTVHVWAQRENVGIDTGNAIRFTRDPTRSSSVFVHPDIRG